MNDEELLYKQVQMTTAATKNATVWVYRCSVYAYPWYVIYTLCHCCSSRPVHAKWQCVCVRLIATPLQSRTHPHRAMIKPAQPINTATA